MKAISHLDTMFETSCFKPQLGVYNFDAGQCELLLGIIIFHIKWEHKLLIELGMKSFQCAIFILWHWTAYDDLKLLKVLRVVF